VTGALDGLVVVELGGEVAAAYATKLLALLGARVVKVEPPGGDPLRAWGPFPDDVVDIERGGGLFRSLNFDKESVTADLSTAAGVQRVLDHVAVADVVIESLGAGTLEAHGLGPERMAEANHALGLVRISDFGQHGPHVGVPMSALTLQAMGGWVSLHGLPGIHPVQVGGRLHELTVGAYASCSALTVARAARQRAELAVADLAALECLLGTLAYPMLLAETMKALGMPAPENRRSTLPGIVACKDGWVGINALTGQHFKDICAMFGIEELADRQLEISFGGPIADEFYGRMQPMLDSMTAEEIVQMAQAFRIPAAPVGDGRSIQHYAQFQARPFFTTAPEGGYRIPGPPWRLGATPARVENPAPALGSDAAPRPRAGQPPGGGAARAGDLPFAGVFVIDLGTFWAGPYAAMYFGALGADVVKIESIQRPDGFRFSGAFPQEGADWYERSGVWQGTNLDKRDLTLDLTTERGRELLLRLVAQADVVVENFSARVIENFRLDYEQLRAVKPDLVMVRMPGFGLQGPWRDYVGWAMGLEQASGMANATGYASTPMHPGGFLDPCIGMHTAAAIQAALEHRDRTGIGQMIEVAQLEMAVTMTAEQIIEWSMNERIAPRIGNRHRAFAPQGVYRCADGRHVALTVRDDDDWTRLVDALGAPAWARDMQLSTMSGRRDRHDELDVRLAAWAAERDSDAVVEQVRAAGVPVARTLAIPEMYDEPQLVARGWYEPHDNRITGTRRYPGWPMRFSFAEHGHRWGPPTLGEHNAAVLSERLGLSPAEIDGLVADGLIGDRMAES
jgi:crotonobetainyl-CoA:carnitine CoA-transferase CaiB-like acyl-CoA transferase